jgi:methionine salvage enolase-phosphatase E1
MLKKLLWLGFFALVAFGVYEIFPYVAKRYQAYLDRRTKEMAQEIKNTSRELTLPATEAVVNRSKQVKQQMQEIDQGQEADENP